MGSPLPYRIDLFDDEIESIRTFDVDTQRSIYPVKEIRLLPAREFPLDDNGRSRFRTGFRENSRAIPHAAGFTRKSARAIFPPESNIICRFFEQTATLFDYLAQHSTVCLHGEITPAIENFWQDTRSRYQLMRNDPDRPLLPPMDLFLPEDQFYGYLKSYKRIEMHTGQQVKTDKPLPVPFHLYAWIVALPTRSSS